jgi:YtkA-like
VSRVAVRASLRLMAGLAAGSVAVQALAASITPGPGKTPSREAVSTAGSFVAYVPTPDPIPLNELFTLTVRVSDPGDRTQPITDAVVTASAWMPAHNHGTALQPRVESHGDGTATVSGLLLHMAGHWELRLGIARKGQMERVTFDVWIE